MIQTLTVHGLFAAAAIYLVWRFAWPGAQKAGACGGCHGCGASDAPGKPAAVELRISAASGKIG